jgi:hypothetical protein
LDERKNPGSTELQPEIHSPKPTPTKGQHVTVTHLFAVSGLTAG